MIVNRAISIAIPIIKFLVNAGIYKLNGSPTNLPTFYLPSSFAHINPQVYLVLGHANSLGEICRVPRKAPKLNTIPTFHENILGKYLMYLVYDCCVIGSCRSCQSI